MAGAERADPHQPKGSQASGGGCLAFLRTIHGEADCRRWPEFLSDFIRRFGLFPARRQTRKSVDEDDEPDGSKIVMLFSGLCPSRAPDPRKLEG